MADRGPALSPGRQRPLVRTAAVMGTVASVHVHDDVPEAEALAAAEQAFDELRRLEEIFSTFRPDSAISRINDGRLHPLDAGPEVVDVLDACTWLEHASAGAFRARQPASADRPERLDPTGFVKGWATERAGDVLWAGGLRHWYLSVGGDLQVRGGRRDGRPFRVAVADPTSPGAVLAALDVVDAGVATSGTAERGAHLWDGRTGRVPTGLLSLTVVGPHLTWADAFATAAFAMGEAGLAWVGGLDGYEALAVTADERALSTSGFEALIAA